MTEYQRHALTKVPAVTLGFWIIKILATTLGETGGDTVTMTWLGETTPHPVTERLSHRHRDIRRAARGAGDGANQGPQVQPVALLGDDRRFNDLRDDARGLRRSVARHRLSRRLDPSPQLRPAVPVRLVQDLGTVDVNTVTEPARRDILLDHDHLFADARHCAGRLDRGCGARLFRRRVGVRCGVVGPRSALFRDEGSAAYSCSGRRSSLRARSAQLSATFSTSRSQRRSRVEPAARFGGLAVVIVGLILLLPQRPGRHPGQVEARA